MKRLLLLLLLAITYSCQEIQLPAGVNDLVGGGQFIAFDVYPSDSEVGEENNINLPYAGISGSATSCTLTNLNNITETTSCSCVAGLCSVGVSGILGGASASFDYIIIAGSKTSNLASGSFNISSANSAPIADDLTPADLTEDVLSRIDLSYTDADSDVATSCSVFSLVNVDEVTECSCTLGACSVDIRGTSNYNGAASFSYTVSTGTDNSNTATASFTIAAVDDAPTTSDLSPSSFDVNTQETITLTYNDIESDEAISCATSNLSNLTIESSCSCLAGVCRVEVSSSSSGAASFDFNVTANSLTSNTSTASFSINSVSNTAPVASDITPSAFSEDLESVITLFYSDADSDQAVACNLSNLTNIEIETACSCSAGSCSVGVRGLSNYNGSASFDYTVSDNDATSNSASANLTINAVDDLPVVDSISNISVFESSAMTTVDAADGGDDFDVDGESLTYSCSFDGVVDGTLSGGSLCSSLPGAVSFNASTGVLDWTPAVSSSGSYEVFISASDGISSSVDEVFTITVSEVVVSGAAPIYLSSTYAEDSGSASQFKITMPVTITGSNRLLLVNNSNIYNTPTSVKFNNQDLLLLDQSNLGNAFYYALNPPLGTYNLEIEYADEIYSAENVTAHLFENVDLASPSTTALVSTGTTSSSTNSLSIESSQLGFAATVVEDYSFEDISVSYSPNPNYVLAHTDYEDSYLYNFSAVFNPSSSGTSVIDPTFNTSAQADFFYILFSFAINGYVEREAVTSVATTNADGSYTVGAVIDIVLNFSDTVTVDTTAGTPFVELNVGGHKASKAIYSSGSGTNTLNFSYTVRSQDHTSDLSYVGSGALVLNGGVILDSSSEFINPMLPESGEVNSLSYSHDISLEASAPYVTETQINYISNSTSSLDLTVNTSGDNRLLLVGSSCFNAEGISLASYDGVALTEVLNEVIVEGVGDKRVQVLSLTAPSAGEHTLTLSFSNSARYCSYMVYAYTGVNQTTPFGIINSGIDTGHTTETTTNLSLTSTQAGALFYAASSSLPQSVSADAYFSNAVEDRYGHGGSAVFYGSGVTDPTISKASNRDTTWGTLQINAD